MAKIGILPQFLFLGGIFHKFTVILEKIAAVPCFAGSGGVKG